MGNVYKNIILTNIGMLLSPIMFVLVFLIYLAVTPSGYHWDSIALAQFAENGSFFVEGWRQHALLTLINGVFYNFWGQFFHVEGAIIPLSVLNCFLGALGAVIFLLALKNFFQDNFLAFFGAIGLAFSLNYWHFSTMVETHIVSTFFLIAALYFISSYKNGKLNRDLVLSGFFMSLSLFSSSANIVFLPAFLIFAYYIAKPKKPGILNAAVYLAVIFLFWAAPYAMLGVIQFYKNAADNGQSQSLIELAKFLFLWFKSQLYIAPFQTENIFLMAEKTASSMFFHGGNALTGLFFCLAALFVFIFNRKKFMLKNPGVVLFVFTALIFFLGTLLFYEPFNLQRYTPLLVFIWLFICLLLKELFLKTGSFYRKTALFVILAVFFLNNLINYIIPCRKVENNVSLQEAFLVKKYISKGDIVITRGSENWANGTSWSTQVMIYIPYFVKLMPVNFKDIYEKSLKSSREAELAGFRKIINETLDNGKNVFVLMDALLIKFGRTARSEYPIIYSELSDILKNEYKVLKYKRENGAVLYKLSKK